MTRKPDSRIVSSPLSAERWHRAFMRGTHSEELGRGHSRPRSQGQGTSSPLTSPGAWSLSLPPGSGPQTRLSVCDSCRSSVGRQGSPLCMPHRSSPAVVREAPQPPRQGPGLPVRKASFSHFTDGKTKAAQEIEGPGRGPASASRTSVLHHSALPAPCCPPVKYYRDKNPASGPSLDRRHRQALVSWVPLPLLPQGGPRLLPVSPPRPPAPGPWRLPALPARPLLLKQRASLQYWLLPGGPTASKTEAQRAGQEPLTRSETAVVSLQVVLCKHTQWDTHGPQPQKARLLESETGRGGGPWVAWAPTAPGSSVTFEGPSGLVTVPHLQGGREGQPTVLKLYSLIPITPKGNRGTKATRPSSWPSETWDKLLGLALGSPASLARCVQVGSQVYGSPGGQVFQGTAECHGRI